MYIKSGSRFDSVETSGTSALLLQMLLRSAEFTQGVAKLGAKFHVHTDREIQGVTLAIFNDQANAAIDLLTKVFSRDLKLSETGFEAEKEILRRRGLELQRDQMAQTFSCLYETSFEDHTMGLPMLGLRDNIPNLTLEDVEKHRDNTFLGGRMALVISGNPGDAESTLQNAQTKMSAVPSEPTIPGNSLNSVSVEKPHLTSTFMAVRDDEMTNLNIGVCYLTAPYGSEHHFFYQFFQELVGQFNANEHGSAHVNAPNRQYSLAHTWLGEAPGMAIMQTKYHGYSDMGVFTNYLHGHELWGDNMIYMNQYFNCSYARESNTAEVYRARARIFNNLLSASRVSVVNNLSIGQDLLYVGRRIGRNESARRISAISESSHVTKVSKMLFYDKDIALATYGPQHLIDDVNYYDRQIQKSTVSSNILYI